MKKIEYFTCEVCGKRFNSEEEALQCEAVHAEEKARANKLAEEKADRKEEIRTHVKELTKLIEAYNKDYGEAAEIPYTNTLFKTIDSFLGNTFFRF